jgi:hypothetical protein
LISIPSSALRCWPFRHVVPRYSVYGNPYIFHLYGKAYFRLGMRLRNANVEKRSMTVVSLGNIRAKVDFSDKIAVNHNRAGKFVEHPVGARRPGKAGLGTFQQSRVVSH